MTAHAADFNRIPVVDVPGPAAIDDGAAHRVVNVSARARSSIPVFYDPDLATNVECPPNCASADHPARDPPIVAGDDITARYDGTYTYRQKARQDSSVRIATEDA